MRRASTRRPVQNASGHAGGAAGVTVRGTPFSVKEFLFKRTNYPANKLSLTPQGAFYTLEAQKRVIIPGSSFRNKQVFTFSQKGIA
jgi:hypothetical protein